MTNDISVWGGGLVEIKAQNHLQLIHQTVLEFTMDLLFKRIVLGDVAAILNENGHSFYFKYWLVKSSLVEHEAASNAELWVAAAKSRQSYEEELKERKLAANHAEKSESTTGISQLDFINSVPTPGLQRLFQTVAPIYESNAVLLTFASSYGLTLCIRDWIARNPGELRRISLQRAQPPLLTSLAFEPVSGVFHEGCLTIARLLLENGYNVAKDTKFFPRLMQKVYNAEAEAFMSENDVDVQAIIVPMYKLFALVLDRSQDTSIFSTMSSLDISILLHTAPPDLAAQLIRRTAVNLSDSMEKTLLDWTLTPPGWCLHWSLERRYEVCCLLVNAGGLMSSTPFEAWTDVLTEFDNEGYDTRALWSKDTSQLHDFNTPLQVTCSPSTSTQPPVASAPVTELSRGNLKARNSKQRHCSPCLLFLDLLKKQ